MTWSELLNQPKTLPLDYEIRRWKQAAIEFGDNYNVVIRLKCYNNNRCGELLMIEMYHPNDPKNVVRYKKSNGTYISARDSISNYFEHLYEKLPIVRRKKFIKEQEYQRRLEGIEEDFN